EQKKSGRRGNADRSKPTRALLADVLPGFRLVWRRRAADVQEVFDPADARHLQDGLFNGRDLIGVVDLAANRDDAGVDIEIDLPLRQLTVAQHLAFHAVAQGQIIDG